jgi:anaerobic magnesium-protoporphyrin IX monomethyl ester cyclase
VLLGEAEQTIVELLPLLLERRASAEPLPQLALAEVPGLALRGADGGLHRTATRPYLADLDALPFPAWDLLDVDRYQRAWREAHGYSSLSLITSRGCPFRCNWCAKPVFGRRFRQRAPERVAAEMRWLKTTYAPDQVRIVDDILGVNRRWLFAWRDAVLAAYAAIPFECLSRVDLADREVLDLFKQLGCKMVFFGAESGSQRILDAMDKGITVEQTYTAARAAREVGVRTYFYTMLGYPPEDMDDIRGTARMLRDCLPDRFSTTVAYPLPGTSFYETRRTQLRREHDWVHSAQNVVPFDQNPAGALFYRWVQRWLHREVAVGKLARGLERKGILQSLRLRVELVVARLAVELLHLLTGRPRFAPAPAESRSELPAGLAR